MSEAQAKAELEKANPGLQVIVKTASGSPEQANQLQDFAIQVAGGANPLLAFAQQGSQLSAVYGGVGNALRAVAALVTPMTVAVTAGAVAVGGLA